MHVVTHTVLATRRRRQALVLSLGGTAVLVAGLILNLRSQFGPALIALAVGAGLSWAGVALADRWVAVPRPDRAIADGLKERTGRVFRLYNWVLPADHVLLAPWGLTVFAVYNQDGPVIIQGPRWRDGRPLWQRFFRLGRRPVKHPAALLSYETDDLRAAVAGQDETLADVPIEGVAVFTNRAVDLRVARPDVPVLRAADLRDWVKQAMKRPRLSADRHKRLERALDRVAEARLGAR